MKKFAGLIAGSILSAGIPPAAAEDLVAVKHIRVGSIISAADIATPKSMEAMRRASKMIGQESARTLYQGQPIAENDVRAPTLVRRNAIVQMEFQKGMMTISTEGRALDDGGMGSRIRVMNLTSKRVITTIVTSPSTVVAVL